MLASTVVVPPARSGATPAAVTLRPYRPGDREAVRAICCDTAFRNLGAAALLDDRELFADYWTAYYVDHEPEAMQVAETDGRVVGYLMGCMDSARFRRVMARRVVPGVLARLLWRASRGRYREQPRAHRFIRWLLVRSWREEPAVDIESYPAHYHVNLTREGYRLGLYTTMAERFLDLLEARGVTHLHGQVLDAKDGGVWERMVGAHIAGAGPVEWRRWECPSTLGRDVLGIERPMVNRAFGGSVPVFRGALRTFARRFRI